MTQRQGLDPITRNIIKNYLESAADTMAVTVVRTARSLVVRDNMDFSTAIFNAEGDQVAQGLTLPFHMGAMQPALDAVREHFQDLFRKLFGGGRAEIVLEDEDNILESGIEIIARPPGKEPRSISQLSGGEKTLTALAILLAIFRSRPSPFCVFDEVDAALDESNIDRLMNVLEEFRQDTQFVIVTHSKRTMINAGVLYGVTMQESGVSTRVAVRFEDVREDGDFSVPDSKSTVTPENNETDLDEAFTSRHRKTPHWNHKVAPPVQANADSQRGELDPDSDSQ